MRTLPPEILSGWKSGPRWPALLVALAVLIPGLGAVAPRGEHPRLFYTAARIAALQHRLPVEASTAAAWAAVRAEADRALGQPDRAGKALDALVLTYRMTGDARYAAAVRDVLRHELARPNWEEGDLARRDPVWHAGLGLAATLLRTAVAFDAIHDFLPPDERKAIAAGIVARGIEPTLADWIAGDRRIHALDTMGHNWWSACVFAAGVGALAVLDEEPRAAGWLDRISAGSVEWFGYAGSVIENKPANFDRAGAFYESVNYSSFALSQYLLFRLAWNNALRDPPPPLPLLDRAADFFVDVCYPNAGPMMTLNFGDGSVHADGSRPLSLLWANGWHLPSIAWYLAAARAASYREGFDRSTPFGLLYFPSDAELAAAPAQPARPRSTAYEDIGWAMLRSAWDPGATFLGVRAGYTWNHAHADAGSFILFHRGRNLLVDSGNCSYARPEYDGYYRQSTAHNVVLFNGQAENPEDTYAGSKFPGSVSHLIDAGDLRYVFADATGPTSRVFERNYRHVLWLGDVILVIDDVEAFEPGQFEWLLHVGGKAERRGLDLDVADGEAAVRVRPLFPETFPDAGLPTDYPEKMRLVEKTGLKDHEPDTKVIYYAFAPSERVRRTKFVTAITLVTAANRDRLPQFERLTGKDVIGVRIRQAGGTSEVYLNLRADGSIRHRNANNVLGGWETDAYLLALDHAPASADAGRTAPDGRVFVADGSYLRRENTVVLDSLSKVFATWVVRHGAADVLIQGQPVLNVELRTGAPAGSISINGAKGVTTYDPVRQALRLRTP